MSGLLGTSAVLIYDINLIMQIVILFTLLLGFQFKRMKNYSGHGKTMMFALALNLILIIFVMVPSLVIYAGALLTEPLLGLIIALHAICGTIAALLAITIIIAWRSVPAEKLGCRRRKRLMRPTITIWTAALLLGITFYVVGYIL
jgi:uncharacterized membrane protein YozB (DUF420 family)